jgi:uracil-DNA glycosylase
MNVQIEESWKKVLQPEFEAPYFHNLVNFVKSEYASHKIYPPGGQIFNAFNHCSFDDVRVVIIGQDPYHGHGQANGLCFSVSPGVTLPPSLRNIFQERKADVGVDPSDNGDLTHWARQGVLLLNATLTVRAKSPGSHQKKGWEEFTDGVIRLLSAHKDRLAFILWGAYAQRKGEVIDPQRHFILKSPHPSPFSANRGFFGSRPFSKVNEYLQSTGQKPIDW